MTDQSEDKSKSFDRIRTAKLRSDEIRVPSLEDIRKAVQRGDYVIDFDRLASIMSRKLP